MRFRLNLGSLWELKRTVELGSMTKAVEELGLSQPALTRRIKQLEHDLRVEVLVRDHAGVVPIDMGTIILERAQGLFDEARRLEEAIAAASSQLTGEVAVCLPTSLHLVVMRPFLKATADRLPDIRIRFIDAFDTVLQEQLVKKDADLGIIIHDADSSVPGLRLEPLVTDALFLIGTAGAPGDRTSIKITDLADQRLVLSIGGAEAVHMEAKIGTIEVGKCADIVLVTPMHDAVAGVALNARPDDVDTVIINGRIVKRNGSLLHAHWPTLRNRFKESCERIIDGYRSTDSASAVRAVDQWAIPRA